MQRAPSMPRLERYNPVTRRFEMEPESDSADQAETEAKTPVLDALGRPSVVNVSVACLRKTGYKTLLDWLRNAKHLYIGRDMEFYVKGAKKSKWHNPYPVKKPGGKTGYTLQESLRLYEQHVRSTPALWNALDELNGKTLGCWCIGKYASCHGEVLVRLLEEKWHSNRRH